MSRIRFTMFTMFLMLGLFFLPGNLAAKGSKGDTGQYVILGALYGDESRNVDVTARLRELAKSNKKFTVGNDTLQGDPDPGVPKTLRIYANDPNGKEEMFEYREGSEVNGAKFKDWRSGNWGKGWSGNWH